ncbi:MAG: type VI secretion system contractile sheath large subunit [Candidatus Sulfotelmatobacter sp.]
MPPFNFGEIKIAVDGDASPARPEPDAPFRVLLLGDFSGRSGRAPKKPLPARQPVLVDRDNFDAVLAAFHPELQLGSGNEELAVVQFSDLDDFHPDQLLQRVNIFRKLREMRARLANPDTFADAAEEFGLGAGTNKPREAAPAATPQPSALALGNLLDDMIEQTEARVQARPPAENDLQKFVRRVTEPHLVSAADPRQAEILLLVDRALGAQMRALLHVPDFQALEAAWRAVFLLVRRIDTDEMLKLYLVDLSEDELLADLNSSPDLRSTWTYSLLAGDTTNSFGAQPWAAIVGNYTFGATRAHAESLGRLAKIAHAAKAPFLAAASPALLGCESFSTSPNTRDWTAPTDSESVSAWTALRALPEANAVGLAVPRFLLRLPYGKSTDPIESFSFEEMPDQPEHDDYLWGNPAFVCARLLAQSFSESGWDLRPGQCAELDRLPVHVYQHDGDSEVKPCAEALMTVDTADQIMESGLMPLASMKGQDEVRLVRFQSIAQPLRALAARWNS